MVLVVGERPGEDSESRKGNRVELWRAFALPVVIGLVVLVTVSI